MSNYQIARRELDRRVLEETGSAELPATASASAEHKAVAVALAR